DPPLLRGTAPVVGNGRHVPDRDDAQANRRQRLDGRLAAAARALHPDVHPAEAQVHGLAAAVLRGDRGGKGRALLRPLEARLAGGAPGQRVALEVGDGDQHVVERRRDVGNALALDDFLGLLAARGRLRWCGHLLLRHFLLAGDGTARTLLGPGVRVRALPADRKTAAMANAAIAPDIHQALDVHGDFGAERSLDAQRALDVLPEARHFGVREVPDPRVHA